MGGKTIVMIKKIIKTINNQKANYNKIKINGKKKGCNRAEAVQGTVQVLGLNKCGDIMTTL